MAGDGKTAFFQQVDDHTFQGRDPARGPWSADHCHAGPATGLIARSAEHAIADLRLTRLNVDLVRPIPMERFSAETTVLRRGRATGLAETVVCDGAGRSCAIGRSLFMQESDLPRTPTTASFESRASDAVRGAFPVSETVHGMPAFADFIGVAYPAGEGPEAGPTSLWMRTPPLLPGEDPTPFQSICPVADCGSGISRNANLTEYTFVNVDIAIVSHRDARGAWLRSNARSFWEPNGIGLCVADISDEAGHAATVMQTLLLKRVSRETRPQRAG